MELPDNGDNLTKLLFTRYLPSEFQFLSDGLNKGLYRKFMVNHSMKGNHYAICFNPSLSDKSMIKGKHFQLEQILIIQNGKEFVLNISIYDGLFVGFEIEKNITNFIDFEINMSKFQSTQKTNKIKHLVDGLFSDKLDLDSLGEFEIEGQCYYEIKDLQNGNYIAININGQVFGLIHNPYKIELINSSVSDFVNDVNNERFCFETYFNNSTQ